MNRLTRRFCISLAICIWLSYAVLLAQELDIVQTVSDLNVSDDSKVSEVVFELNKPSGSMLVNWTADVGYSTGPLTRFEDFLFLGVSIEKSRISGLEGAALLCVDARSELVVDNVFHSRLAHRAHDMPGQSIKSKLSIDGDMGFYVSNRGELVAVELSQLSVGEGVSKAWTFDMVSELGVFKRDAGDIGNSTCSPLTYGENIYCLTGHRTTFGYRNSFPHRFPPNAPSFITVNKRSGQLVWQSDVPNEELLLGQWGSPVAVNVTGVDQIVFPGGDGTLYGIDPKTGKLDWLLPCNPNARTQWTPYKRGTKCFFQRSPLLPMTYSSRHFAKMKNCRPWKV